MSAPPWLNRARALARLPPARPRMPLLACMVDEALPLPIGSVEPELLDGLRAVHGPSGGLLLAPPTSASPAWHVMAETRSELSGSLGQLASALRAQGLTGPWRDELLAVRGPDAQSVAGLERGLVRVLGVATQAVHLMGYAPDGRVWVQQRALDKANDPGLWDTLMGGMVPASDSMHQALERETWEEAGLRITELAQLLPGGRVHIERPSEEAQGRGYMIEDIDWFSAVVPAGMQPLNQDGEVAQFACLSVPELLQRLERGDFTLEASLVLAQALLAGKPVAAD